MGNKARIVAPVKEGYSYRADAKEQDKSARSPDDLLCPKSAIGAKGAHQLKADLLRRASH